MKKNGYNLMILSIILAFLGVFMSVIFSLYRTNTNKKIYIQNYDKLKHIQKYIKNFALENNRFPCPSQLNCNINDCNFEIREDNECSTDGIFQNNRAYYGHIPTNTIGLANSYGLDFWGNKIVYVVSKKLTKDDGYENLVNGIATDYQIQNDIMYLLISHNKNRIGSYNQFGTLNKSFSDSENMPIDDFTIDENDKKYLILTENINTFALDDTDKDKIHCLKTTRTIEDDTLNFDEGKFGEIVFSNEMCPKNVNQQFNSSSESEYYYLSDYFEENILQNNRPALRCGKNGEWEENYIYTCKKLPQCSSPSLLFSDYTWAGLEHEYSNTAKVRSLEGYQITCIANHESAIWKEL
jgi:hypothetical protein